jgi:hypothetical protein
MEGAYRDIATAADLVRYREPPGPQPASMRALAALAAQRLVEGRDQLCEGVVYRRGVAVGGGTGGRALHAWSPVSSCVRCHHLPALPRAGRLSVHCPAAAADESRGPPIRGPRHDTLCRLDDALPTPMVVTTELGSHASRTVLCGGESSVNLRRGGPGERLSGGLPQKLPACVPAVANLAGRCRAGCPIGAVR